MWESVTGNPVSQALSWCSARKEPSPFWKDASTERLHIVFERSTFFAAQNLLLLTAYVRLLLT